MKGLYYFIKYLYCLSILFYTEGQHQHKLMQAQFFILPTLKMLFLYLWFFIHEHFHLWLSFFNFCYFIITIVIFLFVIIRLKHSFILLKIENSYLIYLWHMKNYNHSYDLLIIFFDLCLLFCFISSQLTENDSLVMFLLCVGSRSYFVYYILLQNFTLCLLSWKGLNHNIINY